LRPDRPEIGNGAEALHLPSIFIREAPRKVLRRQVGIMDAGVEIPGADRLLVQHRTAHQARHDRVEQAGGD
jgi:hypothetical protein